MQLDRKTLAFLQMPSSKGDLYAPPSGSKGPGVHCIDFIRFIETDNFLL